jgi:hypothetical protein
MNGWRTFLGFVVTNLAAGGLLLLLLDKWLWPRFFDRYPEHRRKERLRDPLLTFLVGTVERILYTLALYLGAWQWVGFWVGIKVAIRWRSKSDSAYGSSDNIWIIGTVLSILSSFLGAYIVLGQLPLKGTIH